MRYFYRKGLERREWLLTERLLPDFARLDNGWTGRTPAVETLRCPNRSKSKKERKTKPEAQMRLGFRSFVLPVDRKKMTELTTH